MSDSPWFVLAIKLIKNSAKLILSGALLFCIILTYLTMNDMVVVTVMSFVLLSSLMEFTEDKITTNIKIAIVTAFINGAAIIALFIGMVIEAVYIFTDPVLNHQLSRMILLFSLACLSVAVFRQFSQSFGEVYSKYA